MWCAAPRTPAFSDDRRLSKHGAHRPGVRRSTAALLLAGAALSAVPATAAGAGPDCVAVAPAPRAAASGPAAVGYAETGAVAILLSAVPCEDQGTSGATTGSRASAAEPGGAPAPGIEREHGGRVRSGLVARAPIGDEAARADAGTRDRVSPDPGRTAAVASAADSEPAQSRTVLLVGGLIALLLAVALLLHRGRAEGA